VSPPSDALANRLSKNAPQRRAWAKRENVTAFRLYDLDMPEWPIAVDAYGPLVHVIAYPRKKQIKEGTDALVADIVDACVRALGTKPDDVFVKVHEPKAWGEAPFEKRSGPSRTVIVEEYGRRLECNLSDFLDTGLFLDHRVTRRRVGAEATGKRFLNLFAYTGAFSVHALAGGAAATTTVDLSNTYCAWAERNFALNGFEAGERHRVIRDDVLAWLEHDRGTYDLIVVDPPSFSASKKMGRRFEVQRDHLWLVQRCLDRLAPDGALYFSNNFLEFELSPKLSGAEEITQVPKDFRRAMHRCWRLSN
jgi:23S rRNA (cytosine1962-C5)-methyltransferase